MGLFALWFLKLDISAVVRSIGEARFAGNSENKWHLVGDNLAAPVACINGIRWGRYKMPNKRYDRCFLS